MSRDVDRAAQFALPDDAVAAACLLAVAPQAFGGLRVRARAGPQRDAFLNLLKALLPAGSWHRLPPSTSIAHVRGGLDLAATLAEGRPVNARGLISHADGGVIVLPMAERLPASLAGCLSETIDRGCNVVLIALDEGIDDERMPEGLADRLALHVDLDALSATERSTHDIDGLQRDIAAARHAITIAQPNEDETAAQTIATLSLALDVRSLRAVSAGLTAAPRGRSP